MPGALPLSRQGLDVSALCLSAPWFLPYAMKSLTENVPVFGDGSGSNPTAYNWCSDQIRYQQHFL